MGALTLLGGSTNALGSSHIQPSVFSCLACCSKLRASTTRRCTRLTLDTYFNSQRGPPQPGAARQRGCSRNIFDVNQ